MVTSLVDRLAGKAVCRRDSGSISFMIKDETWPGGDLLGKLGGRQASERASERQAAEGHMHRRSTLCRCMPA